MKTFNPNPVYKRILLLLLFVQIYLANFAQVTEIYTDYGGYWKSTTTVNNPNQPTNSHNVIGFNYNSIIYSTGVNNALLTSNGVSYTASNFKALPITSIGGTITAGTSTYIALGTLYDGVVNGYSSPLPSVRMVDVLTDGINGLNIGTGVTNIPSTAALNFPVSSITISAINDAIPDILFTQTAVPTGATDSLYFANSAGTMVGIKLAVTWTSVNSVGTYLVDLYNLSYTTGDASIITSGNLTNQVKEIRLVAFKLSDFGITAANAASISKLIIRPGGTSDPAFVAYNSDALTIPSPAITTQPQTQVVCPGTGQNAIFSVVSTGSALAYQWKKNGVAIIGAISSTYTVNSVSSTDAGSYEVDVTNYGGTITSSIAYLNTVILTHPSPATQTIATGNTVALSVNATNATGYQWKKDGADVVGATGSTYSISTLTTANSGSYTVNVINSAGSGCASMLSNVAVVTASTILYCKTTGNLNVASNWGVSANGTGSTPVNFTRSEHTFKISNQATAATGGNLTIAGTLDLMDAVTTITPGTTLNAARIIRSGTGTLSGSSTSNLTVDGVSDLNFTTGNQVLKNLTIAGGAVTLNSNLDITAGSAAGALTVSSGVFNTSDKLSLKSDANGTASIASSAGTINGNVAIERYIPARRAWRLMAAPISSANPPSINIAWQEGAISSTSNPNPGFGTHITGGSIANGFDQSPTNVSSLKYFNGSNWATVASTYNVPVTQYPAYMFFIRGNRAYDIITTSTSMPALTTILRVKGNINQGTQAAKTVAATGYTLVGNPYASPIDFSLVAGASTNIKNRFRVWNPGLGGTNGVGAYVLLDWNGSGYTATPTVALNSIIQAGQAFFVESNNGTGAGSLLINESHKNTTGSIIPFGRPVENPDLTLSIDLKIVNEDSTISIADGVLARYDDVYNNNVDNADAAKFLNNNENISIISNSQTLSVERRGLPNAADTLKLKFTGIKNTNYQLEISSSNFSNIGLVPELYDKFRNTFLTITGATVYSFDIIANPLSKASDRFAIVFRSLSVLPVDFIEVKVHALNASSIIVEWKAEKERNIKSYEVQRSDEPGVFRTIGNVTARNVNGPTPYHYNDLQLVTNEYFYRIKSIDLNGEVKYSTVVKVKLKNEKATISIWPNPVTGNTISLRLQNVEKGKYQYNIIDNTGQVVSNGVIDHGGNQPVENIKLPTQLPQGNYQLCVAQGTVSYQAKLLIKR